MTDEAFFKKNVPQMLSNLHAGTTAQWGLMTPQHMIEHLVGSWRISNGRAQAKQVTPQEKLEQYRTFLFSEEPFPKNATNPVLAGGLPPLRKPDLEEAKKQLIEEIEEFFHYFEKNPEAKPVHPVFGELDKKGWLVFQQKHMTHHFRQFGLM